MKKELDDALCKDFPNLYVDRNADMRLTCMCWGFDVGDGWHSIIRELSEKLEELIVKFKQEHPDEEAPRASQVKEKFGTLRFYMQGETDEMYKLIEQTEAKSAEICEECGEAGELRKGGWLKTLCDSCYNKDNG